MPEPKKFTRSEIAAMSHAEYLKNRQDIMDATNSGRIIDDGGKPAEPEDPKDRALKAIEAAGGELFQPSKKTHFLTSQIREMTPEEYKANGIAEAYRDGRVHVDNPPKPLVANPTSTRIVEGGGDIRTPQWQRKIDREAAAKKAEADAKIEAEKTTAQRYLESIGRGGEM